VTRTLPAKDAGRTASFAVHAVPAVSAGGRLEVLVNGKSVAVLDLPVTGKEEDAVDQLSLFILTDGSDDGEKAALDGARSFYIEGRQEKTDVDELPFWDEHSLGEQRFYNIICAVYGQNKAKYSYLVKEGTLPPERAERCEGEYEQIERSWSKLLAPHLKKKAE